MPTTVHLPPVLLEKVDQCARSRILSRNQFIIRALEKAVEAETAWSPAFLEELHRFEPLEGENELLEVIRSHRSSKAAPRL